MKSRTTDQLCSDIHITLLSWITAVHFSNQSSLIAALQFKRYSTVYMSDIFSHLAEMNGTFLNVLIQKRFSKYVKLIETVATKLKPNLLFEVKRNIQVQIPDWADTFCLMSRALVASLLFLLTLQPRVLRDNTGSLNQSSQLQLHLLTVHLHNCWLLTVLQLKMLLRNKACSTFFF